MWAELKRIIKPCGVVVLFGSEPFSSLLRCSNLDWYKYDWIWEKNNAGNFQLANIHPLKIHENISVFYNEPLCYVFSNIIKQQMAIKNIDYKTVSNLELSKNNKPTGWLFNKLKGTQLPTFKQWSLICSLFEIENEYHSLLGKVPKVTYNKFLIDTNKTVSNKGKAGKLGHLSSNEQFYTQKYTGYPKTILRYNRENGLHPTQKPVELLEYLIKTYSNENETVLDFTFGSCSTGVACLNTNRNFIGIEKDEHYYKIGTDRLFQVLKGTV